MKNFYLVVLLPFLLSFLCCQKSEVDKSTPVPTLESISPATGKYNTVVTLGGSNFSTTNSENVVTFNGKAAVVTSSSSTQISVMVPKGAGSGKVMVETKAGSSAGLDFKYEFTTTVSTVAGSTQGYLEGAALSSKFNSPVYAIYDPNGNLLIADRFNHRIRKIDIKGNVSTFVGTGVSGDTDGDISVAELTSPTGLAFDSQGNLYVSEASRIRKISPSGQVSVFAGTNQPGFADGTGTNALFSTPCAIAFDSHGNLIVADRSNNRIRKITPTGEVSTIAGDGTALSQDGNPTSSKVNGPWGIAISQTDVIYFTEFASGQIRKISSDGTVSTIFGNPSGFADGDVSTAKFAGPYGVSIDSVSNLYIADGGNYRIRKIEISEKITVTTLAGTSTSGFMDGDGTMAQFGLPYSVLIGPSGSLIVADRDNFKIRKLIFE